MRSRKIYMLVRAVLFMMVLSPVGNGTAGAVDTPYAAPIVYRQTNTLILDHEDIKGWPEGDSQMNNDHRQFTGVTVSADGSQILFSGCAYFTDLDPTGATCRPFVVNPDGTALQDASSIFPPDVVDPNWGWGWGNMRINDDGSRFFIKVQRYEWAVIDEVQVYYYDIPGGTSGRAEADGFWPGGFDWFNINIDGSQFYHGKYDGGAAGRGLWYTNYGGAKNLIFDVSTLPCDPGSSFCNHLNLMGFLGSAAQGGRNFFSYTSYYESNASPNNKSAMWYTDLAGNKQKLTNEDHHWVWPGDWRGTSQADGTKALYGRRHAYGDPYYLYTTNVATGAERLVTWTSNLNGMTPFMTRSGRYVFVNGGSGDYGHHYHTLFDLNRGTSRDTWSYHFIGAGSISNITADDRYYYATTATPTSTYQQRLYRVDTNPGPADFGQAPNITGINLSSSRIRHDLDPPDLVAAAVTVTDSQGLANIDWVRLAVLVDGAEEPPFAMGREPLAFPTGDAGGTYLYDDGTHGDETAGDGIFTFDAIATRKGDYEGFNTWYTHYGLPHPVGIRIIAKDVDHNYTIADTTLTITEGPSSDAGTILLLLED